MSKDKGPYAEREEYPVYIKDGVTYVPHYSNSSVYVGPGYPRFTNARYSENDLLNAGAVKETRFLWTRGHYGTVTDARP